jgi:hypothetical protein
LTAVVGFIDRQADPEVDGVRSALCRARFLMEDVGGEDPHALAERLRDCYRLISRPRDPIRDARLSTDFSKWVHTAEACPPTTVAPIWRLRVTVSAGQLLLLFHLNMSHLERP